jgi:hypothetical protein
MLREHEIVYLHHGDIGDTEIFLCLPGESSKQTKIFYPWGVELHLLCASVLCQGPPTLLELKPDHVNDHEDDRDRRWDSGLFAEKGEGQTSRQAVVLKRPE